MCEDIRIDTKKARSNTANAWQLLIAARLLHVASPGIVGLHLLAGFAPRCRPANPDSGDDGSGEGSGSGSGYWDENGNWIDISSSMPSLLGTLKTQLHGLG